MDNNTFASRLNILRAGVLGANDGIISIAGVVIGVASATDNLWIIFLSAMSAIFAGAFSMAGGEYVSVSTQKDTEAAAVVKERKLLEENPELARANLYQLYLANGECETAAKIKVNQAFAKDPIKALVEEKYGVDTEEFTNPWHAALSSFLAFAVGSLPPTVAIMLFAEPYRIPVTVVVVAVSLLATGYISARLGNAPTKQAMIRNLAVGLLTMLVTYMVGQVFHVSV